MLLAVAIVAWFCWLFFGWQHRQRRRRARMTGPITISIAGGDVGACGRDRRSDHSDWQSCRTRDARTREGDALAEMLPPIAVLKYGDAVDSNGDQRRWLVDGPAIAPPGAGLWCIAYPRRNGEPDGAQYAPSGEIYIV